MPVILLNVSEGAADAARNLEKMLAKYRAAGETTKTYVGIVELTRAHWEFWQALQAEFRRNEDYDVSVAKPVGWNAPGDVPPNAEVVDRLKVQLQRPRCPDCGKIGESKGHPDCKYDPDWGLV